MTGKEAMEYIKDADSRAKQKAEETKEMDVVKKEAVTAAKAAKRKPKARPKRPVLGR